MKGTVMTWTTLRSHPQCSETKSNIPKKNKTLKQKKKSRI